MQMVYIILRDDDTKCCVEPEHKYITKLPHETEGGLEKHQLLMNKHGRIVSRKKHMTAKKEKRLVKAGYGTKKGKFGYVRVSKKKGSKKTKKRDKRGRYSKGGERRRNA